MSAQPSVNPGPQVSDAEWQALLTGIRQMADKVAGLSRRIAAVEQQLNPDGAEVSGQAKWITWVVRAVGLAAPAAAADASGHQSGRSASSAAAKAAA